MGHSPNAEALGTFRVLRLAKHITEAYVTASAPNVTTDLATVLSDFDTAAAAIIAITGDTYAAHQFAFGGSTGLTHTQWATVGALINTAVAALLTAQADLVTLLAAPSAAKATARALPPQDWIERPILQKVNEDMFEYDVVSSDDGL